MANANSPWAYLWEGLLSEGYLRLRFGVLLFGRAYFEGAYDRNFKGYVIGEYMYILHTLVY